MRGKYTKHTRRMPWKGLLLTTAVIMLAVSILAGGTAALIFHQTPKVENRFESSPYTWHITYNDDSIPDTTIVTYEPALELTVTDTVPSQTGYNFIGWADDTEVYPAQYASGQALSITPDSANVTGSGYEYTVSFYPLQVIQEVTLVEGAKLSAAINGGTQTDSNHKNATVQSIRFCDYEDLQAEGITAAWQAGVDVDAAGKGDARLFRKDNGDGTESVYICVKEATETLYANKSSSYSFAYLNALTAMEFGEKYTTEKATTMERMFTECSSLKELDLSGFNTENVTSMTYMFRDCNKLENLDVSSFNTGKVTEMAHMFANCRGLTELDVSSFNTASVRNMASMFMYCSGMETLTFDKAKFTTGNVTDMYWMFGGCSSLTELDVTGFDTAKVERFYSTFSGCSALTELDVSNFDTGKAYTMGNMFKNCAAIQKLDVTNFDTDKVTAMETMFYGCYALTELDVSGFDTAKVTSFQDMFAYCKSLTELDVSGFVTEKATAMSGMFNNCEGMQTLDVSNFDTGNVTSFENMFNCCKNLTELDVSNFDTGSATSLKDMFAYCTKLETLDVSGFDTANVTDMRQVFNNCVSLVTIYSDADWDVSKIETSRMNLETDMDYNMFNSCHVLVGGEGTPYRATNIGASYAKLDRVRTEAIPGYFTDVNIKDVILMDGMNLGMVIRGQDSIYWQHKITDLIFCDYEDLASYGVTSTWVGNESSGYTEKELTWENGVIVDDSGLGNARLFRTVDDNDNQKVYICVTEKVNKLYLNEMASVSFYGLANMTNVEWGDKLSTELCMDMLYLFCGCYAIEHLDLSFFDTSNVTTMQGMFDDCTSLKSVDLSSFDTSSVTSMMGMFEQCYELQTLDLSNFDTSSVTTMQNMFEDLESVTELDLSSFETSKLLDTTTMFQYCDNLQTIKVSDGWEMTNVTKSNNMFNGCDNLEGQNGTAYSASHIDKTYARVDAAGTPGYLTLKDEAPSISKSVTLIPGAELREKIAGSDASAVTSVVFCDFADLEGFTWTDGVIVDDAGAGNARLFVKDSTVYICTDSTRPTIYLNADSAGTFKDLTNLSTITWDKVSSRKATTMAQMFSGCNGLAELDLSSFDTGNVTDMTEMFYGCTSLATIYAGKAWSVDAVTADDRMFQDCTSLISWMDTAYSQDHVDSAYAVIDQLVPGVPGYLSPRNITIDDPGTVTLIPGRELNALIKGSADEYDTDVSVGQVMFCNFSDVEGLITSQMLEWTSGVPVDNNRNGVVRLFDLVQLQMVFICVNSDIDTIYLNEDSTQAFNLLTNVTTINFGNLVSTAKVTTMEKMFFNNAKMTSLTGMQWDTSNVTNMAEMFYQCKSLNAMEFIQDFDTSNVVKMQNMFAHCPALTTLDLSSFDTSKVTDMTGMFQNSSALTTIYVGSGWTTQATTVACDNMFAGCTSLVGGNGTVYSDDNPNNKTYAVVDGDTPDYLTSNVAATLLLAEPPAVAELPEATLPPEETTPEETVAEETTPEETTPEETEPTQPEGGEEAV